MSAADTIEADAETVVPAATLRALVADLDDVPVTLERKQVKRRSRDFYWYSPVLNEELAGKFADVIVSPRDEADVIRTAAACFKHRVPLTPRGAATGNYGQCMPLRGGVLLDMNGMDTIERLTPGAVRVGPGMVMSDLDAQTRPQGFELRMHPSTKRKATIGGFVAGGSGGIGSVTWGGLREKGNIRAARIVTMEAEPRIIELQGEAAQNVNRAYGTTGIITALEMGLAPAWDWIELIVAFDTFDEAMAFADEAAHADGIVKKVLAPIAWPLPTAFRAVREACPEGRAILIAMVAEASLEPFRELLAGRGDVTLERPSTDAPGQEPLYEYTWNHTTLHMLKGDRSVTYLQCLHPQDRGLASVSEMSAMFPDEILPHVEFSRFRGRVAVLGLPVLRYTTRERLDEIIAAHERAGVVIANPHVATLEDGGGEKRADADQLGFKRLVDPRGLLNPGKMRTFVPVDA